MIRVRHGLHLFDMIRKVSLQHIANESPVSTRAVKQKRWGMAVSQRSWGDTILKEIVEKLSDGSLYCQWINLPEQWV